MYITWFGQSCFKLQGKTATVVTDPFDGAQVGLKLPRVNADIVTVSHDHFDHNNVKGVGGDPLVVNTPGEFEVKQVQIQGIPSWHDSSEGAERGDNTIFRFIFEDLRIAHLGDLGTLLSDEQLEQLGNIDVLMIPVGGVYTLNGKRAVEVVNQIEPRMVIPMHYKIPKLKIKLESHDQFCTEIGIKHNGAVEKLRVTKKELPTDEMQIHLLTV